MSAQEKSEVLTRVEETRWGKRRLLASCGCPRALTTGGGPLNGKGSRNALLGFPGTGLAHWRRPRSWRRPGSLRNGSSRQLATWITDHLGLSVAESTVYRLLKKEGLIKAPMMQLLAGKEYQRKTSGPHQMWPPTLRISEYQAGAITTW